MTGGDEPTRSKYDQPLSWPPPSGHAAALLRQVVLLRHEEGLISIKELYTDGTKIEANANRYTVWGNAIKTNREKIKT